MGSHVDAYLATRGFIEYLDHTKRNVLVDSHLKDIAAIYIDLFYKESRKARYYTYYEFDHDTVHEYKNKWLPLIKEHINKLLNQTT